MSSIPVHSPSSRRLLVATGLAVVVAAVLLVTAVLPAEFGIDPTGIGARLGLDALAKTPLPTISANVVESNAPTSDAVLAPAAASALDAVGQPVKPVDATPVSKREGAYRTDALSTTLAPGKGAEIKAQMLTGDGMVFRWTASGPVAVDMHGERTGATDGEYTSYWIEPARTEAAGSFTAPFDGSHGWYWLNRGAEPVTIQVEVAGFQQKLFVPGHP